MSLKRSAALTVLMGWVATTLVMPVVATSITGPNYLLFGGKNGSLPNSVKISPPGSAGIPLLSGTSGTGTPTFGALNLAGGSSILSGILPTGNLPNGLFGFQTLTTSAPTLTAASPSFNILDPTSNAVAVVLPLASTCAGKIFWFKTINTTNTTSITCSGSDLIESSASLNNTTLQTIGMISDGVSKYRYLKPMVESIAAGGTGQSTKAGAYDALSPMSALGDVPYGGTSGTGTRLAGNTTTTKKFLRQIGNGTVSAAPAWDTIVTSDLPSNQVIAPIGMGFDGGGSAISTGLKSWVRVPMACTIQDVEMVADQSGSIVVDIWKGTYSAANLPTAPTSSASICASAKPTISSSNKSQDVTLTGWTTSISAGDYLYFNVNSCTTITKCTIALKVLKN